MIPLVKLREMPLFAALSEERMRWVCSQLEEMKLDPGQALVEEGDPSQGFFILLEGEIQATKLSDGVPLPAGHHAAPAFFGEVPLLAQAPLPVTIRSVGPSRLARLDDSAFRTLIAESQEFAKVIFQTMASPHVRHGVVRAPAREAGGARQTRGRARARAQQSGGGHLTGRRPAAPRPRSPLRSD